MKEFSSSQPNHLSGQLESLKQQFHIQGDLAVTHGRFNLASDGMGTDILAQPADDGYNRYLVVQDTPSVQATETALTHAGIATLSRIATEDTLALYEVPVQAKPLANERLFPHKQSTETYVSDAELSTTLGWLWGTIYKTVGQLPPYEPMAHTGMLEFASENGRLFPIPPYMWATIEDPTEAAAHFLSSMKEELLQLNSTADYSELLQAASEAWKQA